MTLLDEVQKFIRKAAEDEVILRKHVNDPEVSDSIWGFHAQQAIEKLFKAVLIKRSILFPKTHDLTALFELLEQSNHNPLPFLLDELDLLTAFAVIFRYDDFEEITLDRAQTYKLILSVKKWAENEVNSKVDD